MRPLGGIIVLRRARPDLPRPFRTPWVPLMPILGVITCLAMASNTALHEVSAASACTDAVAASANEVATASFPMTMMSPVDL